MKPSRSLDREALVQVLAVLRAQRGAGLGAGMVLACATALAGMALLGLSGWFISATALAGLGAGTAWAFDVFAPSAGIRLLALGRTGLRYGERLVTHDATLAVLAGLRERLFRGWSEPQAARRLLARPAQLLFRLTSDIDALEGLYLRLLVPAATLCASAVAAGLALSLVDPVLGLALAGWLVAGSFGVAWWLARRARRPARLRAHATEALRARTVDLVAGQTELAMATRLAAQRAHIAAADRTLARADDALNRLDAAAGAGYGMLGAMALAGTLLAVGALVEHGAVGVPVAALALLLVLATAEPFAALKRGALDIGRTLLAARRIAPRLQLPPAGTDAAAPVQAALCLAGISAAAGGAGGSEPVLHRIDLQLAAGERVALIGPSGAGKSTLLALVAGELTPLAGRVQAVASCLLTQHNELFRDSLRDNLCLALPGAGDARLWDALSAAGLAPFVHSLAAGLDTVLGEGGLGLSGGQARRLALARLLLRGAPLWLLDEPTEGVDPATARDVLHRLAQHAEGHTLLIATHLRREAALANRLVCLRQGRIVADVRRGEMAFDGLLQTLRPD